MCDEFGSDMDISGNDSGFSDVSDSIDSGSDVSDCDVPIDFESEGIFDEPQDILPDIPSEPEDVYEASTLDEIEILEDSGDTHTVAERLEELYEENPMGEQLTPALKGLEAFESQSSDERLEEIQAGKERLEDLKASLLAGDQAALEMFGLESPDTSEEDGHQKVLTR